jgi:hypothetical protein
MTIDEYSDFYQNLFKPAYADLVAIIADKPQQIIFEIENSFSHIMVYHSIDVAIPQNIKDENLVKAHSHLVRATMDCYKILWTELSDFLDKIIEDESSRTFSFNDSEAEVMKIWKNFKEKAQIARTEEMKSVGVDYINTINLYKEAVDEGKILLDKFDFDKFKRVKKFNFTNLLKNHGIGFGLGIISGVIATWIMT